MGAGMWRNWVTSSRKFTVGADRVTSIPRLFVIQGTRMLLSQNGVCSHFANGGLYKPLAKNRTDPPTRCTCDELLHDDRNPGLLSISMSRIYQSKQRETSHRSVSLVRRARLQTLRRAHFGSRGGCRKLPGDSRYPQFRPYAAEGMKGLLPPPLRSSPKFN